MSISQRSTKAALYSEIERLRALLDGLNGQITMQAETIKRRGEENLALSTEIEGLTTMLQGRARMTAARGDRATRMLITKRLAVSLGSTVRWNDENGFEHKVDGQWVAVPRHTLEFVTRGLEA